MKEFFDFHRSEEDNWVDPERTENERSAAELKNQLREAQQRVLWQTGIAERAHGNATRYRSKFPPAEMCGYDVEVHIGGGKYPFDEAINVRVIWEGGEGRGGDDLTVWRRGDAFHPYREDGLTEEEVALLAEMAQQVKFVVQEPEGRIYSLANKADE